MILRFKKSNAFVWIEVYRNFVHDTKENMNTCAVYIPDITSSYFNENICEEFHSDMRKYCNGNVMKCYGMLWNVMECEMLWNVMECNEMIWNVVKCYGMQWNVMECKRIPFSFCSKCLNTASAIWETSESYNFSLSLGLEWPKLYTNGVCNENPTK